MLCRSWAAGSNVCMWKITTGSYFLTEAGWEGSVIASDSGKLLYVWVFLGSAQNPHMLKVNLRGTSFPSKEIPSRSTSVASTEHRNSQLSPRFPARKCVSVIGKGPHSQSGFLSGWTLESWSICCHRSLQERLANSWCLVKFDGWWTVKTLNSALDFFLLPLHQIFHQSKVNLCLFISFSRHTLPHIPQPHIPPQTGVLFHSTIITRIREREW